MKCFAWCLALILTCSMSFAASSGSFDWPQWQGPNRDATSKETGLLQEWPKDGPPLAWKIKGLGGGYGELSVAAGKLYGMGTRGEKEVVFGLSEGGGKELWATPLETPPNQSMPQGQEGPGCTPTVDGDRLYVIGMAGEIACLSTSDGKILWHHSMTQDFGGSAPTWSYRESPLIDGQKVICTPGAANAMMVALDKLTGNVIWKTQMPQQQPQESAAPTGRRRGGRGGRGSGAAYASAIAFDFEGTRQYAQMNSNRMIGVDASTGKLLWQYAKAANPNGINCTTPIYQDGMVFGSSAYGAGAGVVKLSKEADGSIKANEVWFSRKLQNHHGGVILYEGCLYGANGGNEGGALICLDFKTGNVLWNQRTEGRAPKGSIAFADHRFYYRCEDGTMLLFEPSSKEYIERGRFTQPDRSESPDWAHPVIANGKLYLRDQDVLLCYDVKAK